MYKFEIRAEINQYLDNKPYVTLYEYDIVEAKNITEAIAKVEQKIIDKVKYKNLYDGENCQYKLLGIRVRYIT